MARVKGKFKHGLKIGKECLKDFELHDHLTAGMLITAKEQAEKVVPFETQPGRFAPVVVESPAKLGALILCQQIASVGYIAGPLDYDLFAALHEEDLAILNLYADIAAGAMTSKELSAKLTELGVQAAREVTQRGRDAGPGGDTGGNGTETDPQGRGPGGDPGDAAGAVAKTAGAV